MKPVVGFIGLGHMGLPMAERILASGYELVVWNRDRAKTESLVLGGARAAGAPAEVAADCDLVITCLANELALQEVVFGPRGVTAGPIRASLLADASTVDPRLTQALAGRLSETTPMRWVDAPVSGGPAGARAGTLATMAGGEGADVERIRPVAMTYSARVNHMGPVGAGQTAKTCNQILFFGGVLALAEAAAMARRMGLDPERLPDALAGGFGDSGVLREYGRAAVAGQRGGVRALVDGLAALHGGVQTDRFRGKLDLAVKDAAIVRALSQAAEVDGPMMVLAERLLRALHDPAPPILS